MEAFADFFLGRKASSCKKFVSNKSVAVVGPAKVDKNYSSEIDSHDIVVRFNHLSDNVNNNSKGENTDIVYYTGEIAKRASSENLKYPQSAKWFVTREGSHVRELEKRSNIPSRSGIGLIAVLNGTLNMVPLAVVDLLHLNPSKISVYGANHYLDKSLYDDEYLTSDKDYENVSMIESFSSHDSLWNFILMKNLYSLEYVVPDDQLRQVLELSEREYMTALKRIHAEQRPVSTSHV
jgi:hypothetical protein